MILNPKMEFPTEWTMPNEVEERHGKVDELPDHSLRLAAGDPPGAAGSRIQCTDPLHCPKSSGFGRIGCLLRRTQVAR